MTLGSSVALVSQIGEELSFEARVIAALCNHAPADRWMRHNPVTPEEVQALIDKGQTVFPEIRGRFIDVKLVNGTLDLSGCARVHGVKLLEDAHAAASGSPIIRV